MKRISFFIIFLVIVGSFGCGYYHHPYTRDNPAYNKAWVDEQKALREQWELDLRSRAESDARSGVYNPPTGNGYWYYDDAWRKEKRLDFVEKRRLWERQEGRRAIDDARRGVYQPW